MNYNELWRHQRPINDVINGPIITSSTAQLWRNQRSDYDVINGPIMTSSSDQLWRHQRPIMTSSINRPIMTSSSGPIMTSSTGQLWRHQRASYKWHWPVCCFQEYTWTSLANTTANKKSTHLLFGRMRTTWVSSKRPGLLVAPDFFTKCKLAQLLIFEWNF
jgi:hypothetical protein